MLFLQHAADGSAQQAPPHLPVDESLALHLERALLTHDEATRHRGLEAALQADQGFARWALRAAEHRLGRTINRTDEAVRWLSANLVAEIAGALIENTPMPPPESAQWRLAALVKKLGECNRSLSDHEHRLEHEKLEAMKELAYGAGHEINNPLANIAARAQTLLEDEHDPQRRQKLIAIHRQAMRAHEMIADLMLFARPPKLKPASLVLGDLVRRVTLDLAELAQEYNVHLECAAIETPIEITADEPQLGVAIHAVVKNAIEAVSDDGTVSVECRKIDYHNSPFAEIVVRDDGPGISEEIRQHMFDPFFSGREAGRGLGFGLSKCWRIVADHGGRVVVQRPASGGAELSILLPVSAATPITHARDHLSGPA